MTSLIKFLHRHYLKKYTVVIVILPRPYSSSIIRPGMFEKIKYGQFSPLVVYASIFLSLAGVVVVKLLLSQFTNLEPFPYLLNFFVIVLAAWYGGFRGGLVATITSSLVIWYVFLLPNFEVSPLNFRDNLSLFFFSMESVSLSFIVSKLRLSKSHLLHAFENMQLNQECFQLLLDNVNGYGIFFLNKGGVITDWNDGAQRLFGYSAAEVVGNPLSFVFKDLKFRHQWLQKIWKKQSSPWVENETLVTRQDSTQFWAQVSITPLRHASVSLQGFGLVCRDLSSQKELALQREHFLNDMSHELKTPLTSLRLWVDLMARQQPSQQIKKLSQHTQKLTELINTLLDLNLIQSGCFKLQLSSKSLPIFVKKLTDSAREFGFVVQCSGKVPELDIVADSARLKVALGIFMQNLNTYFKSHSPNGVVKKQLKLQILSPSQLQLTFSSPWLTRASLEPFLHIWKVAVENKKVLSSNEATDSKAYYAAHILRLHGLQPVIGSKPSAGNKRSLVLTVKLFPSKQLV